MSEAPTDWSVKNGAFIGYVLVEMPAEKSAMGMPQKPHDGWLPFAHDLRSIDSLKQESHENVERTALYHGNTYVATVNAPFHALVMPWLAVRHAFDRKACSDEGERADTLQSVNKESR